jgi:hypothetical protein
MKDLNNCTIEYIRNGIRTKIRAIRHLSGKLQDDPNTYLIQYATTKAMSGNTTNDSFAKFIVNKFKSDPDKAVVPFADLLESYKKTMPLDYQKELERIEAGHAEFLEDEPTAISKNAQAYEILRGRVIYFAEKKIPFENFVKRTIDLKN